VDDDLYKIMKNLKGFGTKDAEQAKNIIIAYFSEHYYLSKKD